MKTSHLFLVVISSVLLFVVYSCGSSNEKSSSEAPITDNPSVTKAQTVHEQLLSEGWSYLGRVKADLMGYADLIRRLGVNYDIYFKDGHYTAIYHHHQHQTGNFPRYPVKKGTYRLTDGSDRYTYTGKFVASGDEYYFNF